jgi:hypothetical protein
MTSAHQPVRLVHLVTSHQLPNRDHGTNHAALLVADGRTGFFNRQLVSVARDEQAFSGTASLGRVTGVERSRLGSQRDLQDIGKRAADRQLGVPTRQVLRAGIHETDTPILVSGDYGVADTAQCSRQPAFALL